MSSDTASRPPGSAADPVDGGHPAADVTARPATVRDIELAEPFSAIPGVGPDGRRSDRAWLLVRLHTEPLGSLLLDLPRHGLTPAELSRAIDARFGAAIHTRLTSPAPPSGLPPYLAERAEVLRTAPPITVVLCTRDRPRALGQCLDSLLRLAYPRFRVLVVDNAPSDNSTAEVVRAYAARGPVDYLVEPTPGLSFARNRAVAACPGEILAWIDDDETVDEHWLSELARALARHPEADVVSGVIVPAELETTAQLWFEQFGGHSKGRGFTPAVFSPATAARQHPLYPLPPFATGANMAFRPGVIEGIGGFDTALGAGTPARGSEDTQAFTKVLLRGGTIVYQPTAVVRHYHRRDLRGLHDQMVGYGTGLTAAYTSLLMADPKLVVPMVRLVPTALRDLFGSGGRSLGEVPTDFPAELLRANRRGMLAGPLAYLRGRWRTR
jgi:GT2 family glycosyltransferase